MALDNRGQALARHTKVVHHKPGWVKAGSTVVGNDCSNDGMSSKPILGAVKIRWNGTVEWNGGMDYWNGILECLDSSSERDF